MNAQGIAERLGLQPHPEGGRYRETWRDPGTGGGRGAGTAIYFLLRAGEQSRWHRVDATEIWHYYAGAPLALRTSADGTAETSEILGPDLEDGQSPQLVVPAGHWQSARSLGPWTLAGCTVAPAFEFSGFELAPDGWEPG